MNKKVRPLYDRVLIERVEETAQTAGGLYIPPTAQEKAQIGKVIAVGQGKLLADGRLLPLLVKEGDMVFFGKYAGTEAGDNRLIIREDEILGIVSDVA